MIKRLVLIRGLPGSGKSEIAKQIKKKHKDSAFICATDDYWVRPDGKYDFNIDLLGNSHAWNQNRVKSTLVFESGSPWDSIVVVDNTNINFSEIRPYAILAEKFEFPVAVLEPNTKWAMDVEKCYELNTHGVPYATILRMYHNWEKTEEVISKIQQLGCKIADKVEYSL